MIPSYLQIVIGLLFVVSLMSLLWLVQRSTRNAGIVDVAWAGSIGALGLFFLATGGGDGNRRLLAGLLIAVWSLRLTVYLFRRVVGHPEEGRYATLRAKWGENADSRLFRFFLMQAAAALAFALPLLVISWNCAPLSPIAAAISLAVWTVGMGGVYLADVQLERFKSNPNNTGRTCRKGLWHYSRHPNYFFEWIHWWTYLPLALPAPFWWLALVIPLLLLYFVLFVTGIPPTEAQAVVSRGEDYRRYQQTTSAFVPWIPRKDSM